MACCLPASNFPNANSMESLSLNNSTVWEEINLIQQAILSASSQCQLGGGQFSTTVAGNTPMTFVAGVDSISVTSGGSGYVQDNPTVNFIPPLGNTSASGATASLVTNGGNILSVNITNGGTGYQPIPASLSLSSMNGTGASLTPLVDSTGAITTVIINNSGLGYVTSDSVIATRAVAPNADYVNATFQIASVSSTGAILSIIVTNTGSGYQSSVTTIEIVSTLNPTIPYPLGVGFQSTVLTNTSGVITQVVITNSGYGFTTLNPYLVISDVGTGATTQVNLTASAVSSITVTTPGDNYTQFATGTVFNPITSPAPNPPTSAAVVSVKVTNNTFGTNPQLYWNVWAGTEVTHQLIKPISAQLNTVLSYFMKLGYTIKIQSNPVSTNTIQWYLSW